MPRVKKIPAAAVPSWLCRHCPERNGCGAIVRAMAR
jgi:hypothetical protein